MKKLLTLLLMLTTFSVVAQKPMVDFTVTEIKERNRLEFGTTQWERINMEEYWCIYTVHPEYDFMSMYFFKWGQTRNVMCTQSTKSDDIAREMFRKIIETHHNLGDNKYLAANGLLVDYAYQDDISTHRFMYYNPKGKKPFDK
jgi:hypothetical protein